MIWLGGAGSHSCARKKPGPGRGRALMQPVFTGTPMEWIGRDIVGPLPSMKNANEDIIIVSDYRSTLSLSQTISQSG